MGSSRLEFLACKVGLDDRNSPAPHSILMNTLDMWKQRTRANSFASEFALFEDPCQITFTSRFNVEVFLTTVRRFLVDVYQF